MQTPKLTFSREITQDDVERFANLTGDMNPLHFSDEFARSAGFDKAIVHGMLVASLVSRLVGEELTKHGALWLGQDLKFHRPVYVGDKLVFTLNVIQTSPAVSTVKVMISVTNQKNLLVVSGQGSVKILSGNLPPRQLTLAFVTGASRGIGRAIALELAGQGMCVGVNYFVSKQKAEKVVAQIISRGGKAKAFKADVRNQRQITKAIRNCEKFFSSKVSVLVCNAGSDIIPKPVKNLNKQEFSRHWEVQLSGAVNCVSAVIEYMLSNKDGRLIFVGSIAAWGIPPTGLADYASAKNALATYAKSLALELGPVGITSNIVSPGMTDTELISYIPEKFRPGIIAQIPSRRLARPEDVARVVSFLAQSQSDYINGADIPVAGGSAMK